MKKILLIFILLFLTGCSVNYQLEFNDEKFIESIKIGRFDKNDIPEFDYLQLYSIENLGRQEYYDMKYFNKKLVLNYTYDYNDFRLSNGFNTCYDNSSITYDDDYYYIVTSDSFNCLDYMGYVADEVRINFTTKYLVEESNADFINGKIHTWIVNSDNYDNKMIKLKIHKDEYYENTFWDNLKEGKYINVSTVSVFIFIVGYFIYIFMKKRGMKKNVV